MRDLAGLELLAAGAEGSKVISIFVVPLALLADRLLLLVSFSTVLTFGALLFDCVPITFEDPDDVFLLLLFIILDSLLLQFWFNNKEGAQS